MIIEGATHGHARRLARYLLTEKPGEAVRLIEMRDAPADNLDDALASWELCGRSLTSGHRILMHTHLRLPDGEQLTDDQWQQTIEKLETGLGLENCPRAIVGHHHAQRGLHLHVVWSRLAPDKTALAPLHHDRRSFHSVARWAEQQFDLQPVTVPKNRRSDDRKKRDRELRSCITRQIDREELAAVVQAAWRETTTGEAFRARLSAEGILLKTGDRIGCVIEVDGLKMNPVRLLPGVTTAIFNARIRETEILHERTGGGTFNARRARDLILNQRSQVLANDEANKPPQRGFTRKRRRAAPEIGSA